MPLYEGYMLLKPTEWKTQVLRNKYYAGRWASSVARPPTYKTDWVIQINHLFTSAVSYKGRSSLWLCHSSHKLQGHSCEGFGKWTASTGSELRPGSTPLPPSTHEPHQSSPHFTGTWREAVVYIWTRKSWYLSFLFCEWLELPPPSNSSWTTKGCCMLQPWVCCIRRVAARYHLHWIQHKI